MEEAARMTRTDTDHAPADAAESDFPRDARPLPLMLPLDLQVRDPGTISDLVQFERGEPREQFALKALQIGVLALRQARGALDADAVRQESERLLTRLHGRLEHHAELVNERLTGVLREYFDPGSGRFQERLDRLVCRDGELESLLQKHVGREDSELQKTLADQLGGDSPLMKLLSPEDSNGFVSALQDTLEIQLRHQRDAVLREFSLDNREGALTRFIAELKERQAEVSDKLEQRLDDVVREFSLDEEDSALSRLVRNVDSAQRTITREFSLDEENSGLSRLKHLLEQTNSAIHQQLSLDDDKSPLARLKRELLKLLGDQHETNRKFQEEVRVVLETMKARRHEADRSTQHGLKFEDAVMEFVHSEAVRAGDVAEATGNSTGRIRNSKVGDCVMILGPESAARDVRIVVEAKEDKSCSPAKAREEIEVARKNRAAQVGVFVFSTRTAPDGIEPLTRYGNDILVTWDPEDAAFDIYLRAAISLARALCVRDVRLNDSTTADFAEIDRAILEIEKRAGSLGDIETWTRTIHGNAEKVLKRVESGRKSFLKQLEVLRERTAELRELLGDEAD